MASSTINEAIPASNPVPFAFESHKIRTVINGDGVPWFVAKDTAAALGLVWHGKILDNIPEAWRGMRKLLTPRMKDGRIIAETKQRTIVINEPAVYKLAFRSNKPEADRFTNWIASEVIPALRRTGKYEVCPPAPPAVPAPARLTTAKERNALTTLVNRYVGMLPGGPNQEAYKAAWRKVHDVMGIKAIEELTVEQLPRAVVFVQTLVDGMTMPQGEQPKALPTPQPRTLQDYAWFYPALPDDSQIWRRLSFKAADAFERFGKELDAIKAEAFAPFKENRRSGVATFLDDAMGPHYAMFRIADEQMRVAYRCVYEAMDGLVAVFALLRKG